MDQDAKNYPSAMSEQTLVGSPRRLDITLRQNIDEQIKRAEAQVLELLATKERLEKTGILDAQIEDIRRSMRF